MMTKIKPMSITAALPDADKLMNLGKKAATAASDATSAMADTFRNASPWAIAGGLVVGVGAVAAAPFTGGGSVLGGATLLASLSGATTVATAVAAGSVGVAAGAAMSSASKERDRTDAFRQGQQDGAARDLAKIRDLEQRLQNAASIFQKQNQFNAFMVSLIAVGAAMAGCDGQVAQSEQTHLQEFVIGLSIHAVPPEVKAVIDGIIAAPPSFDEAMRYVDALGNDVWPLVDALLAVVSEADGVVTEEEKAFLQRWDRHKRTRGKA